MEYEVISSRLRDVVEFEVDYIRKSYEQELSEKNKLISQKNDLISQKNDLISQKDDEIRYLKSKLRENGIDY
jgi:uncharacterized protein (DUF3084 family)